jgi:arginyl-tRNA synthetase
MDNGKNGPEMTIQHPVSGIRKQTEKPGALIPLLSVEIEILKLLHQFPAVVKQAGEEYSPSVIANYVYELSKEYNQFYQEIPVLKEEDQNRVIFRLNLSALTGKVIKRGMLLLGIDVPSRM